MLELIPQYIDYIRYTDAKKTIKGELPVSDCTRLIEMLSADTSLNDNIHLEFDFGVDNLANRFVKGHVSVSLTLTCQRCMQDMDYPVDLHLALAFIKTKADEQQIAGLYDSFYIEKSEPIDFFALVEDEIILSLPIIAKHKNENCIANDLYDDKQIDEIDIAYTDAEKEAKKKNPFAILKQLKD
ncbi:MAG: YceD family protein [Pseudomonadota bacterium]